MNWLNIILELLKGRKEQTIPEPMPTITGTEVTAILKSYTSNLWISDETFRLVKCDNLRAFLATDEVSNRPYVVEKHDCDDFSYELMGRVSEWNSDNTFGLVWGINVNGDAHAWNFFIDENMDVLFIEPQNDIIFAPTTEKIWIMIV